MTKWFRYWLLAYAFLVAMPVFAHDKDRPELNGWFDGLKSGLGPCCSVADGKVVQDADWESVGSHYRVLLGKDWVDVPSDAVVEGPNLDGRTLVWPMYADGKVTVRCFMPGEMT